MKEYNNIKELNNDLNAGKIKESESIILDERGVFNCLNCKRELIQKEKGKKKKFCSQKCKFKFWRTHNRIIYNLLVKPKALINYRRKRAEYILKGLCLRCGRDREDINFKLCARCRQIKQRYKTKKLLLLKDLNTDLNSSEGLII